MMIVSFDRELTKQEFHIRGDVLSQVLRQESEDPEQEQKPPIPDFEQGQFYKVAELDNPVLTLDANRLREVDNGAIASHVFGQVPTAIEYDGTANIWDSGSFPTTWPATIDSLLTARFIRNHIHLGSLESCLDIGCGTGLQGQILKEKSDARKIYFSDLNDQAVISALSNIGGKGDLIVINDGSDGGSIHLRETTLSRPTHSSEPRGRHEHPLLGPCLDPGGMEIQRDYFFMAGDAFVNIPEEEKFDLIVASAPPYIPMMPEREIENPLFQGTHLLEEVLARSKYFLNPSGQLVVSHSHLSDRILEQGLEANGGKVIRQEMKRIPQKAPIDPEWAEFLEEEHGWDPAIREGYNWQTYKCSLIEFEE